MDGAATDKLLRKTAPERKSFVKLGDRPAEKPTYGAAQDNE